MAVPFLPVVPQTVTVHMGPPDSPAKNVTVGFAEYIKNVASSEIYPTWPLEALKANIYAITSYALNRIYTEYYRSRGYDFDITNQTGIDQAFNENREVFENIGQLVDNQFNSYIVKGDRIEPFFAQFCNGTTSTCEGLSQWGTVDLANRGYNALDILKYYYGDDIRIVENAPVEAVEESYPGFPLRIGERGNAVKILQNQLNRISNNFPAIPKIPEPNGIFDLATENAVKEFQRIFNLPVTGEADKATWYKIKRYYTGVKALSELSGEGILLEEVAVPFPGILKSGNSGDAVSAVQYYLEILSYFNPSLPTVYRTGIYDSQTKAAVEAFQRYYGINPTGMLGQQTWALMNKIYKDSVNSLPQNYNAPFSKFYPGYFLSEGMQNPAVSDLQTYLNALGRAYPELPELPVTGYFGTQTKAAVKTFQRLFGLDESGAAGPLTWNTIAKEYDNLLLSGGV